jgi:SAM-dependent methyltransferase
MRKIKEDITKLKENDGDRHTENAVLQKDLAYINSNWDIQNNSYIISSHRGVAGRVLIKGRELIHGEVRRYVDPIIWKQKEFNRSVVAILSEMTKEIEVINSCISEINNSIAQVQDGFRAQMDDKISLTQAKISSEIDDKISLTQAKISSSIEEQAKVVIGAMNEDIENCAWLAGLLEERIGRSIDILQESSERQNDELNYFIFEEKFRGSRTDIKERQSAFLDIFKVCNNVLDIGCGRGEFLEILREHEIRGKGIDIDEDMVKFCRSKGLDVDRIDAISYLDNLEDKSLDGVFIDQVVEHLEPDYLIRMLNLCYKKLIYGGTILIETVNPLSFFSFANFYIDMSHKRPIHPETLRFLLNAVGFRDMEIKLIAPVPDEARLKKIEGMIVSEGNREAIDVYNHNIEMLNNTIYGPQDYTIIGRK